VTDQLAPAPVGPAPAPASTAPGPLRSAATATRRLFRDRPLIPLIGLLMALVVVLQLAQPGIVTAEWVGVTVRTAIPLAILAGCQTLAMLTGGIDLSVGAVA
jgi:ribose transport system permease protein